MSDYTFQCLFSGLSAFVPNRPLQEGPQRMRVILPEGEVAAENLGLPHHYAVAIIPTRNLQAGVAQKPSVPDVTFRVRNSGEFAVYFLRGLDLSFDFNGQGLPIDLNVDFEDPVDPQSPAQNERDFFYWCINLNRFVPAASVIDPSCLSVVPDVTRVAARIEVTSGSLRTALLAQLKQQDLIFEFSSVGGAAAHAQALAEQIIWTKEKLDAPLRITGRGFGTTTPVIDLALAPADGETSFVMEIACLEWLGVFRIEDQAPKKDVAEDIKLLYRLTTGASGLAQLPIPRVVKPIGTGRPVHCPNAAMSDNPLA